MLNFEISFGESKNNSEVCCNEKIKKMKFTVCNMCRMMWKTSAETTIA